MKSELQLSHLGPKRHLLDFRFPQEYSPPFACLQTSLRQVKDEHALKALSRFFVQVHSRSYILTKETIAECYLRDSCRALVHRRLSLECWSSQKTWAWKNKLGEGREGLPCQGFVLIHQRRGQSPLFSLSAFNCSARRLHQHFPSIWKRRIMQERQH